MSPDDDEPASVRSKFFDTPAQARAVMAALGVHPGGVAAMSPKFTGRALYVKNLSAAAANVLKQEALAAGADAAVHRHVITCRVAHSDALLLGTAAQLAVLAAKLDGQDFGLTPLGDEISRAVSSWDRVPTLTLRGTTFELSSPLVMGILNVTPDSFSDGGRYAAADAALERAREMFAAGAAVVDIGGESTRPGASYVSLEEELARVMPLVEALAPEHLVSVDTRKAEVARRAAAAGAAMINDVSAARDEPAVAAVCAEYGLPLVLMHMKGAPAVMQDEPRYNDCVAEVRDFLAERATWARAQGVPQVVVDPGIGFGKTLAHNLTLLNNIPALADLGFPVMVGHSRKSFLGELTGAEVDGRLAGSLAAALCAARRGAHLLRVHDVAATAQALEVKEAIVGGI